MHALQKMTAIFSLAVVASSAQDRTATWSQEPDSFRGLKFGSSEAEEKHNFGGVGRCIDVPGELRIGEVGPRGCGTQFTIGDTSVNGFLRLANDKFVQGMFKFDSKEFEKVRDTFIERYGRPQVTSNSEVKNRMGATFTNQQLRWHGQLVQITLAKYTDQLTESMLVIGLSEFMESEQKKEENERKRAAEKL